MTEKTKSKIAETMMVSAIILASPFILISVIIIFPLQMLAEKIHTCSFGALKVDSEGAYRLCETCGNRAEESEE